MTGDLEPGYRYPMPLVDGLAAHLLTLMDDETLYGGDETVHARLAGGYVLRTDPRHLAQAALDFLAPGPPAQTPAPQACPTRSPYQRIPCDLPDDPKAHAADGHEGSIGAGRVTWPTTVEDHDRWGTRL